MVIVWLCGHRKLFQRANQKRDVFLHLCRVGQNCIYKYTHGVGQNHVCIYVYMYIRCCLQNFLQTNGHTHCIFAIMANPTQVKMEV